MKKFNIYWSDVLALSMILLFVFTIFAVVIAVIHDLRHVEELGSNNYERIDSVKIVDIHGNIILIEDHGKYTKFYKKNMN